VSSPRNYTQQDV